jgi:hypothetical protein
MDLAGRWDLVIEQGTTFIRYFRWEDSAGSPVDLTDYSLRMKIRTNIGATATIASTEGGGVIAITKPSPTTGVFIVTINATDTDDLDFVRGIYDIEAYTAADAVVYRVVQGNVTLNKEVTTT